MNIPSLDNILQELSQIKDKGKELLFLNDFRKNYQSLSEIDKKKFDEILKERVTIIHTQVNELCK